MTSVGMESLMPCCACPSCAEEVSGLPVAASEESPPLPAANGQPRPTVARHLLETLPQRDGFHAMVVNFSRRPPARKFASPQGLDLLRVSLMAP